LVPVRGFEPRSRG